MSALRCALCQGDDLAGVGICSSCAQGKERALIFLQPASDARGETTEALRMFLGSDSPQLSEVMRGRQALMAVPPGHAAHALRALGLPATAIAGNQWHRKLPNSFVIMLFAIVTVGGLAGLTAVPALLWQSWLLAGALLMLASSQLRRPAFTFAPSSALLPSGARAELATALAQIESGEVRELLLDIARVSEQAYGTLDRAFRGAALGQAITELATAAGPLALQATRLERVIADLPSHDADAAESRERVADALAAHRQMLEASLQLLGDIARQTVESPESAAATVHSLLKQVRAERRYQDEAYDALK